MGLPLRWERTTPKGAAKTSLRVKKNHNRAIKTSEK